MFKRLLILVRHFETAIDDTIIVFGNKKILRIELLQLQSFNIIHTSIQEVTNLLLIKDNFVAFLLDHEPLLPLLI